MERCAWGGGGGGGGAVSHFCGNMPGVTCM